MATFPTPTGPCTAKMQYPPKPTACILAMARATPPHCVDQSTYADFYFNVTNTADKLPELKKKFARICEKSGVDTRYSILTEEFLKAHPEFYTPDKPSLEERNAIFEKEMPKLAHEAGAKAIREWGRPVSEITHLIVSTLTGVAIPGADVTLVKSLGLNSDVNRIMLYMLGCYAGVTALRVAKDIAENNPSARILICCSELSAPTFRAPDERFTYDLVAAALFGDGASGVIVGALNPSPNRAYEIPNPAIPLSGSMPSNAHPSALHEPNGNPKSAPAYHSNGPTLSNSDLHHGNGTTSRHGVDVATLSFCSDDDENGAPTSRQLGSSISSPANPNPMCEEKAIYEIHWAGETLAADTERIVEGKLKLDGLRFYLDRTLPSLVGEHVGPFCKRALAQARNPKGESPHGGLGFNDVFWAVHAGGPAILKAVEAAMELQEGKLSASREILRKYGNVSASTVLFVLHELALFPQEDACEWGLAVAFGPGVTIEGVLLRRPLEKL